MFENFGMLPQFGQGGGMGGMMGGFGGGMFGGGMPEDEEEKKKKGGMGALGMISPLMMLAQHHPNMALGMISPLAGGMRALGMFK